MHRPVAKKKQPTTEQLIVTRFFGVNAQMRNELGTGTISAKSGQQATLRRYKPTIIL